MPIIMPSDCPAGGGGGLGEPGPGDAHVHVDFTYDNWPSETSWTLGRVGGSMVDNPPHGSLSESGRISVWLQFASWPVQNGSLRQLW